MADVNGKIANFLYGGVGQEDFDVMAATQYAVASHHHMGVISAS